MNNEIEKKSKTKFTLKLLAVVAVVGLIWKGISEYLNGEGR